MSRSAIRRQRTRSAQREDEECPVCFERTINDRRPVRSFGCSHIICNKCDDELFMRADDRCPSCRAPRTEESKARQMLSGEHALQRSQAMMERANAQHTQPFSIFFPSVAVEEITMQDALLIHPHILSSGAGDGGHTAGLMAAASDLPIMQDSAIRHAVRALISVGTINEFLQAANTLRSRYRNVNGRTISRTYVAITPR